MDSLRTLRKSPIDRATRDGCPHLNVWNAGIRLVHGAEGRQKPQLCRDARSRCAWKNLLRSIRVGRHTTEGRCRRWRSAAELWKRRMRKRCQTAETASNERLEMRKQAAALGRAQATNAAPDWNAADRMSTHEQRTESAPLRAGNWRSLRERKRRNSG